MAHEWRNSTASCKAGVEGGEAVSNITLPRAVIKRMRSELYFLVCFADTDCGDSDCDECEPLRPIRAAIAVFDAALKEDKT
jgi:hypothetical protein